MGVTPQEFSKSNLRLGEVSFFDLVSEHRPCIPRNPNSPNRRALCANKKIAITLYYLKEYGTLSMTANSFGIATNTALAVINEVCNAIVLYVGPKYLHLSKTNREMNEKMSEFETKFGMTQAFGCINCTQVSIAGSSEHSRDCFCYRQLHSLNVEAVCDYKGAFMDVECKWPGSVHDAKVFANSSISKRLRSSDLPTIFQTIRKSELKISNFQNGDPAYPLLPYCMKEYSTCKSNEKVVSNAMVRSAQNPIKCAFVQLKAIWQVLTK